MKDTLKYLRMKNNLSQNKIAEYLGISRQMYIKYESGETEPTVKCVRELSNLYKVSYDVLIDDKYKSEAAEQPAYKTSASSVMEVHEPKASYSAGTVNADSLNYRNALIQLFKLNTDDLIRIASKALRIVEEKKNKAKEENQEMSQEEKIRLFHKLSGCIKDVKIEDWKSEYLSYLDERYGK